MAHDRRILIADDDSEVRLGAAELLAGLGEVVQACDGDEALDLVRGGDPTHLALLDLQMPRRGGYEVFGVLRDEHPEVPCILWSGDATEEVAVHLVRAGAEAFLHKPVRPDELRGAVRRILAERWGDRSLPR